MIIKVLGIVDVVAGFIFLLLALDVGLFGFFIFLFAALLFSKSMFVFTGDKLSYVDLVLSLFLFWEIFFPLNSLLAGIFSLVLFAKGISSFS